MNIILDMDETLLSARFAVPTSLFLEPELEEKPYLITTKQVHSRPFLDIFLDYVFKKFKRVSIWTHGTTDWYENCFDSVIKQCMPEGKKFYMVITRDNGIFPFNSDLSKPLSYIYKYNTKHTPENTFILDDLPCTYKYNIENAIFIKPYYLATLWGEKNHEDSELLRVMNHIEQRIFSQSSLS